MKKLLATGGRDGLVRFHSLQSGKEEFTLNAHQLAVTSVGFSRDGARLASAGLEGDMHVWNVKKRQRLFTMHGHSGSVWDLDFAPGDNQLVSAGHDFLVRVWNATAGQEAAPLPMQARMASVRRFDSCESKSRKINLSRTLCL